MTSKIIPENIERNYPLPGRDNNSQTFRDNFASIFNNFETAKQEISDLQTKAVLKAGLTGDTLNNNMSGAPIVGAELRSVSMPVVNLGTVSGTQLIDYAAGSFYTMITGDSITLDFQNFPEIGYAAVKVQITVSNIAHVITLLAAVGSGAAADSANNLQGFDSNVITFDNTGTYILEFYSSNGGTNIYVNDLSRNRKVEPRSIVFSFDEFSANGEIDIQTAATVITSDDELAGNLSAGISGQTKTIVYANTSVGNTTITVSDAAWGGSNQVNLSNVGSTVTLQYIASKWFAVGSNDVTFS